MTKLSLGLAGALLTACLMGGCSEDAKPAPTASDISVKPTDAPDGGTTAATDLGTGSMPATDLASPPDATPSTDGGTNDGGTSADSGIADSGTKDGGG